MAGLRIEHPPQCEPVTVEETKKHCRIFHDRDDALLATYIGAARESCEIYTRRSFINKGYVQTLDSFPYYTDSVMSQQAYPPSYYSLPRYSTTLWNYSQMIKLFYSRLASVSKITYIGTDHAPHDLLPAANMYDLAGDFLADSVNEPARLFPRASGYWPAVLYVPNAVEIHYVAGCNDDVAIAAAVEEFTNANQSAPDAVSEFEANLRRADVPNIVKVAIMQTVSDWYENREPAEKLSPEVERLLSKVRVWDLAPTRG